MGVLDISLFALVLLVCPVFPTTSPDLTSVSLQIQQLQATVSVLSSELANVTGELLRHESEVRKYTSYVENIQRVVAFGSRHGQFDIAGKLVLLFHFSVLLIEINTRVYVRYHYDKWYITARMQQCVSYTL